MAALPQVRARVAQVKKHRLASAREATRRLAAAAHLFGEDRQPQDGSYLLIPSVSSERRRYLPLGFLPSDAIASNLVLIIPNATLYDFAILTSAMHMAWMRYTCGRLESRYRYSANIVYNNFPWPELDPAQPKAQTLRQAIEAAGQAVLDARTDHQTGTNPASLAVLYAPDTMPANLRAAHAALDALVDKAYLLTSSRSTTGKRQGALKDAQRVALLFERYQALSARLEATAAKASPSAANSGVGPKM